MPPTFATSEPRVPAAPGAPAEADALRRDEARRQTLFRLMEQLSAATSPREAAHFIAAAAARLFEWDAFSLNHYLAAADRVEPVLSMDCVEGQRCEVPPANTDPHPSPLARQIIEGGARLILNDPGRPAAMAESRPFGDKSRRSESLMFAPVRRGVRVLGILSVQSYRPAAYEPPDLEVLQAVADLCSGAMERIRAEQALRESEAHLAQAQAVAGIGSYERSPLTGEIIWSDELYRLWRRDPALGTPTLDELFNSIIHPEDREPVRALVDRIDRTGEPYEAQYRVVLPDGTVRHMMSRAQARRDDQGRVDRVNGVIQDITGRVELERALRENEARLAFAQRLAGLGSFERDLRTGQATWSAEHYRLWGRDPALGPPDVEEIYAAIHPEDRERVRRNSQRLRPGAPPFEQQYRLVKPDGGVRHIISRTQIEPGPDGQPARLIGTVQDITEQKLMEDALRASEHRYALILNTVNDCIWLVDVEDGGRYIFRSVNDAFEHVTGLAREQVLDRPMEEWFPPASLELVKSKYREVVATGRPLEYEETTVLPAGLRVGEITLIPIFNEAGKCTQLLGRAHDVTEDRKNAAALKASEVRYRILADNTDDFVSLVNSKGHRLYVSPSYYRSTGWTPEDLERTDWRTRVHPDDVKRIEAADLAGLSGQATTLEHQILCRDGSWLWMERKSKPLLGPDGRVESFLGCSRNITARRQAEAALRQSESRLRAINDASPLGVFVTDPAGECIYTNPAYHALAGVTLDETLGRGWERIIHPEDHPRAIDDWYAAAAIRPFKYENIQRYVHSSGRIVWVSVKAAAMVDGDKTLGYVGTVEDITERLRLEREILEISDRERDRIGQDLHDGLCQHLVGIAYSANQIAKKLTNRSAAEAAGADQIAVLLDEAITQARQLARGLYPVSLETEGLAAALRELGDQVTQRFDLSCEVKAEHEGPVGGHVVASHLFRIAQEAVSNSVKHAKASWILIHLAVADGRIHLRVTDNGTGLPATAAQNPGMGLHTMNYRAAAIGGTLDFSSATGGGTCVSCAAPLPPTP